VQEVGEAKGLLGPGRGASLRKFLRFCRKVLGWNEKIRLEPFIVPDILRISLMLLPFSLLSNIASPEASSQEVISKVEDKKYIYS